LSSFRYLLLKFRFSNYYFNNKLASAGGFKDVVKLLIEAGASPFEENQVNKELFLKNIYI
jgi:hypothetical protein